jgi:hypothetical protein
MTKRIFAAIAIALALAIGSPVQILFVILPMIN